MNKLLSDGGVAVYYAPVSLNPIYTELYPPARDEEVRKTFHLRVKAEKFCVWKLLETAVVRETGLDFRSLKFAKNELGKWTCDKFYFSLSHSDGMAAVALSMRPVGVDIEHVIDRSRVLIAPRIMTKREKAEYKALPDEEKNAYFYAKWTQKESVFKLGYDPAFIPGKVECENVHTTIVEEGGEKYYMSVAGANGEVRIVNAAQE